MTKLFSHTAKRLNKWTMVIEDKGCVFVKSSIIAIIDSVVYDLYYGKIVIRDNTSNQKKIISRDFHSMGLV